MTDNAPHAGEELEPVSVEEAARILKNTKDSIRRKLRDGRLPGVRDKDGFWESVLLPVSLVNAGGYSDKRAGGRPPRKPSAASAEEHERQQNQTQHLQALLREKDATLQALQALIAEKDARIADLKSEVEHLKEQVSIAGIEKQQLILRLPALEDHSQERRGLLGWFRRKG